MSPRLRWTSALLSAALWLAAPAAGATPEKLNARLDQLVRAAEDQPQPALDELAQLQAAQTADPAQRRALMFVRGAVLARQAMAAESQVAADALRALDPAVHGVHGQAAADLVLALRADLEARPAEVERLAGATLEALALPCAAPTSTPQTEADCPLRLQWQALTLRQRAAVARGEPVLASVAAREQRFDDARSWIGQAQALARDDHALQGRLATTESALAARAGDADGARAALLRGLANARSAGAARQAALLRVNLAHQQIGQGLFSAALRSTEAALPVLRRHGETSAIRTALHNQGIARIGLGQVVQGRQDVEAGLLLWERAGARADTAEVLRELGDALRAAGDVGGALELFHRERRLALELRAAQREATLEDLGQRYQQRSQQQEIALRQRDNDLRAAQLANQERTRRIWALLALVALLALASIALLVRRMRATERLLRQRQEALKIQHERDALTGLANRRHFQQQLAGDGGRARDGVLMLVDIDHFKHINDHHGHAGGDLVLKAVAQRLAEAVRGGDRLARWGGEEFIVHAPGLSAAGADALALRLVQAIGAQPVPLGHTALRVTASIGYTCMPLPPHGLALPWEQALNLADMALYSAKSQGRNRALGIAAVDAGDATALATIEADFETAAARGQVTLTTIHGPASKAPLARAA